MAAEIDAQNIEYVEYLEGQEYDENQEVVTIDEDSLQQVEYIEAQQVPGDIEYDGDGVPHIEGHTIFEHNGRQYMIPNELHQSGQTIVLEDYETDEAQAGDEEQYMLPAEQGEAELQEAASKDLEVPDLSYEYNDEPRESASPEGGSDCYMIYGDEDEEEEEDGQNEDEEQRAACSEDGDQAGLGRQYAVLRDGRLHIEGGAAREQPGSELEGKLQVLEESLQLAQEEEEEEDAVEVTGKNLITGQTISLNGFLEKLKKKSDLLNIKREPPDSSFYPPNVKRQRRTYYNQSKSERGTRLNVLEPPRPNYVLMPPVNRKVLVGKTPDGKNIVGKILQIWKKVDPNAPQPKPRAVRRRAQPRACRPETRLADERIEELIIDNTGKILQHVQQPVAGEEGEEEGERERAPPRNVLLKKKYVSKAFLDQNIVKTLSGLMELESVQRNLAEKNLIVKHILKRSVEGRIVPGRVVTYYYGHMDKSDVVDCFNEPKQRWTFVSHYRENLGQRASGIDVSEPSDTQQVDALATGGKATFGSLTEPQLTDMVCCPDSDAIDVKAQPNADYSETVPVNLIVIEDEYGKKRTKVTIPQLGGSPKCQICHRMFRSEQHLRRHLSQHPGGGELQCETCGLAFRDVGSLSRHGRSHSGPAAAAVRQFVCYVCDRAFATPGSLRRHLGVHDNTLRPLQCLACLQRFADESSLKKHMLLHTGIKPYRCDTCRKCFVAQGDLNFHRRIHEPARRYRCRVCGKEFNRHSNMVRHADIHRVDGQRDDSAYKCEMCGCQYNFISSLTRHIVNKHMTQRDDDASEGLQLEHQQQQQQQSDAHEQMTDVQQQ